DRRPTSFLRDALQCDDRQMLSAREVVDVQIEPGSAATVNRRLWSRARRTLGPLSSWLESRLAARGSEIVVDLVTRCAAEPLVRPLAVVPGAEERQLLAHQGSGERHEQAAHAFALDRLDQSLDDSDAPELPDGTEALVDSTALAPSAERPASELPALIR